MRFGTRFGRSWLRLGLPFLLLLGPAAEAAAEDAYGFAVLSWRESRGPVTSYAVYVDRNGGGFPAFPEQMTPTPFAFLTGEPGDEMRVRVASFSSTSGELSEFSEVSNTIRILPPEPPATAPNLLTNGSFEENPPWRPYTTLWGGHSLPGWRVVGHSIDWVGSFWGASNGGYSLDLNGLWAGGVEQEIVTEPGRFYFVYYALAANPECEPYWKTFRISAAGEDHSVLLNSYGRSRWNLRWTEPEPFVFQADSDRTTLQLLSTGARGNGACGPTVDDVRVRAAG